MMKDPTNIWDLITLRSLLENVKDPFPFQPYRKPPQEIDISQCCENILLTSKDSLLEGFGEGIYHREDESKFGYVSYSHAYEDFQIYFNKEAKEYSVGKPFTTTEVRENMRSESKFHEIADIMGRPPCPADMRHWKFRQFDDDVDFSLDLLAKERNIVLQCRVRNRDSHCLN